MQGIRAFMAAADRLHGEDEEPGAKIATGETVRAAAARGLCHETGLDLCRSATKSETKYGWVH
jgi:hypothetical protein